MQSYIHVTGSTALISRCRTYRLRKSVTNMMYVNMDLYGIIEFKLEVNSLGALLKSFTVAVFLRVDL